MSGHREAIKAKKSLGQNFLTDRRIVRRIVEAVAPQASDVIIEIGPGTGALTTMLVERAGYVTAIEIDPRLAVEIRALIAAENFSLVEADALSVNWPALLDDACAAWERLHSQEEASPRVRVVANLPYYISTPILQTLLQHHDRLHDMTLMLQDEVVERITSSPGGREYGYLSVLTQYYCEAAKLFEVPPSAFKPAPKVWSAIVKLTVRDRPPVAVTDEEKFFALIRAAFAQRRKTIANNLKAAEPALGFAEEVAIALERAGIDARRRAETLSLADFANLYRALYGQDQVA
ncbi:MAG TPA: 16S rRNA (adenine(1518)-N(6)/adenine(1519)-N(6))-dimethyltransferase RsmA [Blastocatellia bacterium]|nr:16S rRNA (adenine(1518)-N(6)/adenine(1519)-N(6))-dimethyltransferase RsmA [Blastocatellia bacterium]